MQQPILHVQHVNEYSGKQIIFKSDRIVFCANGGDLILAAKNNIALSSDGEIHLNSNDDLHINVNEGSKIIIGKPGTKIRKTEQPAVLGTNLHNFLEDIMQLLITFQVTTPSGEGQAGPKVSSELQKIKKKYFTKKSKSYIFSDLLYIADNHI